MVNGLQRLRHHAVIGCHHQHDDVRYFGAACAHAGKGFVAGGIEKHDLASECWRVRINNLHPVGADMLRNSTRLASGYVGFANGIEQ